MQFLKRVYAYRLRYWASRDRAEHPVRDEDHARVAAALAATDVEYADHELSSYRRLRNAAIEAERRALIDLRDREVISGDVVRRLQRDLDFEKVVLEGTEADAPESPYLLS